MILIDKNIHKAKTLPSKFYLDNSIFEQSKVFFEESIQPICTINELNNVSIYPFTYFAKFLNEELLLTNQDGKFHCLSNVCTHRGHLVSECATSNSSLQCRYHGRTFELNGRLKNAPGFKEALNFPTEEDDLKSLSVFDWNNFLFISLNENPNVFKILNQIDAILPDFPYKDLSDNPVKKEYTLDCHWALYCDNYLEGFHIPYVHKGLNEDMEWNGYETDIFENVVLQKAKSQDLKNAVFYGKDKTVYAYYFFIFPNIMLNYYSWGLSINIIEPISTNKTRIKYLVYNLKGKEIPLDSKSSVDTVELEDQKVVLSVQKGMKSKYYSSGRFSPNMEKGVHYFHRLMSKKLLKLNSDF